jgi:hypothetical protein
MRVYLTLRPGKNGTKQLVHKYGAQLICVRYRYDASAQKRYKTVELIEDTADWVPPPPPRYAPETIVQLRVAWGEVAAARAIKGAGGKWNKPLGVWELSYAAVAALGMLDRIVPEPL